MASLNIVVLAGNLTRNVELKYSPSGTPIANFGLAVNRKFKQGEELKEDVCFIDVVAFGKTAEFVSTYFEKGKSMIVEGRLQQQRWETEDGQKRSRHEIVAERVQFGESKKEMAHEEN